MLNITILESRLLVEFSNHRDYIINCFFYMAKYHWEHTSLRFLVGCFPYYWNGFFMYEPTFNIYCTVFIKFYTGIYSRGIGLQDNID